MRHPIPACVVQFVRNQFPKAPEEEYRGYHEADSDPEEEAVAQDDSDMEEDVADLEEAVGEHYEDVGGREEDEGDWHEVIAEPVDSDEN